MTAAAHPKGGARFTLGVDVGGTNTDAVLMTGREVIASAKRATTADVGDGLFAAVEAVLQAAAIHPQSIGSAMIGTTQFINAFVQRRGLTPVAAIRVSAPMGDGVPPFAAWPRDLLAATGEQAYLVRGGAFFDGRVYAPLERAELVRVAEDIRDKGIRAVAISSCFAPVRPDIERDAARIVREVYPGVDITLSSEVGGLGLIDRENAAIMNGALREMALAQWPRSMRACAGRASRAPSTLVRMMARWCPADYRQPLPGRHLFGGTDEQPARRGIPDGSRGCTGDGHRRHYHRSRDSWCTGFRARAALPHEIGGVLTNSPHAGHPLHCARRRHAAARERRPDSARTGLGRVPALSSGRWCSAARRSRRPTSPCAPARHGSVIPRGSSSVSRALGR